MATASLLSVPCARLCTTARSFQSFSNQAYHSTKLLGARPLVPCLKRRTSSRVAPAPRVVCMSQDPMDVTDISIWTPTYVFAPTPLFRFFVPAYLTAQIAMAGGGFSIAKIGVSLLVGVVGGMLTNLLYERLNLSPKPKPPLKELMYRLESLEARGLFEEQEKEEVVTRMNDRDYRSELLARHQMFDDDSLLVQKLRQIVDSSR